MGCKFCFQFTWIPAPDIASFCFVPVFISKLRSLAIMLFHRMLMSISVVPQPDLSCGAQTFDTVRGSFVRRLCWRQGVLRWLVWFGHKCTRVEMFSEGTRYSHPSVHSLRINRGHHMSSNMAYAAIGINSAGISVQQHIAPFSMWSDSSPSVSLQFLTLVALNIIFECQEIHHGCGT